MTVSDGDIVRGVLSLTMDNGDTAKNVFTWLIDKVSLGDWTDNEIGTFVTAAIELIFAEFLSHVRSSVTADTVDVYKWASPEWDYLTTTVPSISFSGPGDIMPAGVAVLLTAYTSMNKVFGRKFLYGVTEAAVLNGFIAAAALADFADAAAEYLDSYSGGTMGPLDFLVPGVYSSKAVDFVPFNGVAVVKDTLSYQRRRKRGVGI